MAKGEKSFLNLLFEESCALDLIMLCIVVVYYMDSIFFNVLTKEMMDFGFVVVCGNELASMGYRGW